MAKPKRTGECHVCGQVGPLTKEHVPPEAAFNGRRVVMTQFFSGKGGGSDGMQEKARQYQRGFHAPVLCERCNNTTGAWYGEEYARFAQYCAERATPRLAGRTVGVDLSAIRPLRVFKQALVIMCATATAKLSRMPEIRSLILNRHHVARPGHLRLLCYLVANVGGRSTGVTGIGGMGSDFHTVAEFAWWPVGWVLAFSTGPLPIALCDVTHWSTLYGYDDRSSITFPMPCWSVASPVPLDTRSAGEVERDVRRNRDEMRLIRPR